MPYSPEYRLMGCYNPGSWNDAESYSVGMSNSVRGVVECHDTCMRLGYNYFGMECADSEGVTCNCYSNLGNIASQDLSECTAASSLCSGPFTQSLGPRLYVMGSQSGVAVYETELGSMPPTQAPTDAPTEPMFTFISGG